MLELPNVTLASATSVNVDRTIKALKKSCEEIKFSEVMLLTDKKVYNENMSIINIPEMDYIQYSHFITYELYKYIKTDYVLIIQEDGFVINPGQWDNKFLQYDYIGAPFPIPNPQDTISYRDPFNNLIRVGNGGFSLRSKKLLSLPTELNLEWKPYFGYWNEDGFFSVHNRHIFENNGCKFAPLEVAVNFSKERETDENKDVVTFGFHGKDSKHINLIW